MQLSRALSSNKELSHLFEEYNQGKFDQTPVVLLERLSAELVQNFAENGSELVNILKELLYDVPPPYTSTLMHFIRTLLHSAPTLLPLFTPLLFVWTSVLHLVGLLS